MLLVAFKARVTVSFYEVKMTRLVPAILQDQTSCRKFASIDLTIKDLYGSSFNQVSTKVRGQAQSMLRFCSP